MVAEQALDKGSRAGGVPFAAVPSPTFTTVARAGRSWHDAVTDALGGDAEWLWLLEDTVDPAAGTPERLLAALDDLGDAPAPDLLLAKVLTAGGDLHPAAEPWIPLLDRTVTIAAAKQGLSSVRLARWGALLVRRAAVERLGPPRASFAAGADDLEWTARLLREGHGYVVPGVTVVDRRPVRRLSAREAVNRLRMLREPIWVGQEAVWFGFELLLALRPPRRPA